MTTETPLQIENAVYDESQIQLLEGMEAVRKRPGMYIGPTDINGLHTMVREVVDNSVDEVMAGRATTVEVTIHEDGSVTVSDDGSGIPVGIHPKEGISTLQLVMTKLHAGGKFNNQGYKVSSGLHGVGVSAVNALSEWMLVDVFRNGRHYRQEYHAGTPQGDVVNIEATDQHGTTTTFMPDLTIIQTLEYSFKTLAQRFREMTYLNKGLRFRFVDERDGNELSFYFEGGIRSYVRHLNKDKNVLHKQPFYVERVADEVAVEVALQYTEAYDTDSVYSFANGINNTDGGAHVSGFRTAITRVINTYARSKNLLKENEANLSGDDVREGLTAVISVKLKDPQFSSQTKEKLVSPVAAGAVAVVLGDAFMTWLEENPQDGKRIIEKCVSAARTRLAVQKVRETARKSAMDGFSLPGKLADCSDTNPARCEIYIVEGDSAGGCFEGSTLIQLVSGEAKTLRELAEDWAQGIKHLGYATDRLGDVVVVPLTEPRLTKYQAELVEVVLDNGDHLRCTADHLFRLNDGSYKRADQLLAHERLMSYEHVAVDVAMAPLEFNEVNDGRGNPAWLPTTRPTDSIEGNHPGLPLRDDHTVTRRQDSDAIRVVAVHPLHERADVYDLTVDTHHNFALTSGVFVHNSAKQGRDRRFQAILPLRGKILNVEKSRLDRMLSNNEVRALITAIGASVGDQFDTAKLRYHRVLIMTDADVDGSHIRTLLLTFFFRYMRPIITNGHLFIAQPPLFSIKHGKEMKYVFSDKERDDYLATLPKETRDKVMIQRYKGLGEMNADQLWETTMNPQNRIVLQVTLEDAVLADETFTMLMGDLVPPRKRFIQTHAIEVRNLDV